MSAPRRILPDAPARRGWCPGLARPMPTGDGLLARIHPPLGILNPGQIRAVAEAAKAFGNGHVDVTARANLQIRGVTEATRDDLAAALEAVDLGDARDDGGPQRLTLTSPLAGLVAALLDVPALARAIEAAGLGLAGLPPKTLVLIEGGDATALPGLAADLYVRATAPGRAALGLAWDEGIAWIGDCAEPEIAPAVAALLRAFARTSRRRIRDLAPGERAELAGALPGLASGLRPSGSGGWLTGSTPFPPPAEGGGRAHHQTDRPETMARTEPNASREAPRGSLSRGERAGVRGVTAPDSSHPSPCPLPDPSRACPTWTDKTHISGKPEMCRKRGLPPRSMRGGTLAWRGNPEAPEPPASVAADDRAFLKVEAPFGRCTADMLLRLADAASALGAGEIRLSPARGFVLLPCASTPDRRARVLADLAAAGFVTAPDDPRRAVAACPGAPACASGSTSTGADAARLAEAFRPLAARGLTAHVSGCAKGCAHPGRAALTLVGRSGRYGIVLDGTPGDAPAPELAFEAALERVRRAAASGASLTQAFRTPI